MIKTTQPTRKMILPAIPRRSSTLILEAIKKPAHTTKRIQPARWNFTGLRSSADTTITSHNLAVFKRITHLFISKHFGETAAYIGHVKTPLKYIR
jgi:hypothetical protein